MINCLILVISMTCSEVEKYPLLTPQVAMSVQNASIRNGVPVSLLLSVIQTESSFIPRSESHTGSIGLMQVQPKYWKKTCPSLHTLRGNIHCGATILRLYKAKLGNWRSTLIAYNIGITNYNNKINLTAGDRYLAKIDKHITQPIE